MAQEQCEDKSGFCYSDVSSSNPSTIHLVNQIQGFESNNQEIFNLTTGMEMIGFSKNIPQQQQQSDDHSNSVMWRNLQLGSSSSKMINDSSTTDFYQHMFNKPDFTTGISEGDWHDQNKLLVDGNSSLRCVFPCEGNERPSQGLSLSLCSTNPSAIGVQSFELRHTNHHHLHQDHQDGFYGKSSNNIQEQQMMMEDGFLGKAANDLQFQLRNSKFLAPAQELLNEFCSLGTKQTDHQPKQKSQNKAKQWEDQDNNIGSSSSSSSRKQALYSLEYMELQKRKTKLLSMLEQVDRRYRHYCNQMKGVVASFEAVAGQGAAVVYSALASKAMSRHFRCLRDGIVGQIQATKRAMGEKDPVAPGASKGETPRLRILDQTLRQQRAFQQMNMMESHPWRPQRGLPERSVSVLRAWLFEHFLHPYPSDVDKHILARQTGLSRSQVSNWFINARVRLWKPMVEEMYVEETKEQDNINMTTSPDHLGRQNENPSPLTRLEDDQKPTQDQLVRIDSDCLSSIITNPEKNDRKTSKSLQNQQIHHHHQQQQNGFGRIDQTFGGMELDFSSYANDHHHQNFNGGGVSLTLGLQQHGGNGVSLAFSPASQSSLFYGRDGHIEECQPVHQYSLLDSEGQNLPYRNLMGAQLLHDLAG